MSNKNLEKLKKDYMNTPIPQELDFIVKKTLKQRRKEMNKQKNIKRLVIPAASIAVAFTLITAGINTSPAIADNLGKIPVIGNVVKVLTFREYNIDEDTYHGNIKTPEIQGLENTDLQDSLNKKYLEENKKLYDEFMEEVEELEKENGGHLGVDSGYVIKTDTDDILSIGRYTVNTVASSSTEFKYDTISKKDNILITLPSLFENDDYIKIISENIKVQMIENNKNDENKIYWIADLQDDNSIVENFEEISSTQDFYINEENKLVISFDKYEVAPGYMGVLEFIIPTEILSDVLVSSEYIK